MGAPFDDARELMFASVLERMGIPAEWTSSIEGYKKTATILFREPTDARAIAEFPGAWANKLKLYSRQLCTGFCCGAILFTGGRLLSDQSGTALQRKGSRLRVQCLSDIAQLESCALFSLYELAG